MKKKLLCCALLGAMSMAQSAMAQDFDDRWYISGTVGILGADDDRGDLPFANGVNNAPIFGFGVGKMVTQHVSIDVELDRSKPSLDILPDIDWQLTSLAVTGRYHFVKEGRNWWPYLAAGIGAQKNQFKTPFGSFDQGSNMLVKLGAGLQADVSEHVDIRLEGGMRFDFNDDFDAGHYQDLYATASVLFALGNLPAPVVPEAPAEDCATKDDDGDGVNNCNDRCPNSQAGQAIGPDGCPVPLTIDLKGVNFDFDKDTLRPDAVVILDEAADILNKYPQLKVEVAGHTDSIGTEPYNQDLSQRRAQVVYNYLAGKGVDASRMVGPNGYGELRPIAPNTNEDGSDNPEGRARNRRTELNVQN